MDADTFLTIIKNTPLVSIDLLVFNPQAKVLVGLRTNQPAKGAWFVPGGRIQKGERFVAAFQRITQMEIGVTLEPGPAVFRGVFQHLYETNYHQALGIGTHYIVLAFEIHLDRDLPRLPDDQHSQYRWLSPAELIADDQVHPNTKAYFGMNEALTLIAT